MFRGSTCVAKNIWLGAVSQFKGIFGDLNNNFLWHESEDINQKKIISKISVDTNFTFSSYAWLYVCFISPIDHCVE